MSISGPTMRNVRYIASCRRMKSGRLRENDARIRYGRSVSEYTPISGCVRCDLLPVSMRLPFLRLCMERPCESETAICFRPFGCRFGRDCTGENISVVYICEAGMPILLSRNPVLSSNRPYPYDRNIPMTFDMQGKFFSKFSLGREFRHISTIPGEMEG